jgi:radical SAM protein with 4Fe4S-binding SPASM domain
MTPPDPATSTARARLNSRLATRALELGAGIAVHRPVDVYLQIASACNLDCYMCSEHNRPEDQRFGRGLKSMTRELFAKLEKDVFPWTSRVWFGVGGEPMISEHFVEFVERAARAGPAVHLTTNGTRFDHSNYAEVVARHVAHLNVSFDAATPATYERIRNGSKWDRMMRGLEKLSSFRRADPNHSCDFTLSFVLMKSNVREFPAFVEIAHRFGADCVYAQHVIPITEESKLESLIDEPELYNAMRAQAEARTHELGMRFVAPNPYPIATASSEGTASVSSETGAKAGSATTSANSAAAKVSPAAANASAVSANSDSAAANASTVKANESSAAANARSAAAAATPRASEAPTYVPPSLGPRTEGATHDAGAESHAQARHARNGEHAHVARNASSDDEPAAHSASSDDVHATRNASSDSEPFTELAPSISPLETYAVPCGHPNKAVYVMYDGRVFPCCHPYAHEKMPMGDLRTHSFAQIWNGRIYRNLRAGMRTGDVPEICRNCSIVHNPPREYEDPDVLDASPDVVAHYGDRDLAPFDAHDPMQWLESSGAGEYATALQQHADSIEAELPHLKGHIANLESERPHLVAHIRNLERDRDYYRSRAIIKVVDVMKRAAKWPRKAFGRRNGKSA